MAKGLSGASASAPASVPASVSTAVGVPASQLVIAYVAVCLVWGSTYFAIRVALTSFAPFTIGAIRFIAAGALLYAFARARGAAAPTLRQWGAATVTGALFFVLSNGFVNVAERSVSSGLVSVLVATMPLWATVLSRAFGETSTWREWCGIAIGFGGVVILNMGGELRSSGAGAIFALVAPIAWALGSIVSKRVDLPKGPIANAAQMLAGGAIMLGVSVATREPLPASPSAPAILALVYLAVFGSLVGFTAYIFLLRNTRPAIATSYAYVNPAVAIGLGVAFAGERLDLASACGAVVILLAVVLLSRSKARKPEPTRAIGEGDSARVTPSPAMIACGSARAKGR